MATLPWFWVADIWHEREAGIAGNPTLTGAVAHAQLTSASGRTSGPATAAAPAGTSMTTSATPSTSTTTMTLRCAPDLVTHLWVAEKGPLNPDMHLQLRVLPSEAQGVAHYHQTQRASGSRQQEWLLGNHCCHTELRCGLCTSTQIINCGFKSSHLLYGKHGAGSVEGRQHRAQ